MKFSHIEYALDHAKALYKKKHKKTPEIWNLEFENVDGDSGCIYIEMCSKVVYDDDHFGGSKTGKKPIERAEISLHVVDGQIDDQSIRLLERR